VNVGLIKTSGIMGNPMKADVRIPMIATRDIGDDVASQLLALSFKGKSTRELLGQRDITMVEAASAIGAAIEKPDLKYVQFPYPDAEKAMMQMGLSADYARLIIEMTRGFNEGVVYPTEKRSASNTTPTSIETFAKTVFAPAFAPALAH
jgi:hypothetical protein